MARKRFSSEFKAKIALEAIKGEKTVAQLSSQYKVHASQINNWKRQAQERMVEAFGHIRGNLGEREQQGQAEGDAAPRTDEEAVAKQIHGYRDIDHPDTDPARTTAALVQPLHERLGQHGDSATQREGQYDLPWRGAF